MNNLKDYKMVKDIIRWYNENNEYCQNILDNINDWMLNYYSIDITNEDIINDINDNAFTKEQFCKAFNYNEETLNAFIRYTWITVYNTEGLGKKILELSDERIMWKIDNDNLDDFFFEKEYHVLVKKYLKRIWDKLTKKYNLNIELVNAGRSGRHIGIILENNTKCIDIYEILDSLIEDYHKEEEQFIKDINAM